MPDWTIYICLGALTFALMAGWFGVVAKATSTRIPRTAVYIAAGFCASLIVFFVTVDILHLGHRLFGWMLNR